MKADSPTIDKTPGRPRDPRIDTSILRAAAELLTEMGYSNVTMAAVAERARTTKTALYRRWSSKAELVHEAAFPATPTALAATSNSFADDVRAMVEATVTCSRHRWSGPHSRVWSSTWPAIPS